MDNPVIIALGAIIVLIAVEAFAYTKMRNRSTNSVGADKADSTVLVPHSGGDEQSGLITIPITQLPATTQFESGSLCEITNTAVISRISGLIPAATQTATRAVADNAQNVLRGLP